MKRGWSSEYIRRTEGEGERGTQGGRAVCKGKRGEKKNDDDRRAAGKTVRGREPDGRVFP